MLYNKFMTSWAIGDRSILVRLTNRADASLERYFWCWASLFLVLFLASSITRDIRIKLWTDELFTLLIAKQASPADIVKAAMEGCDQAPPLYAMIVHSILPIVRHEALAVRLPSTLGYCGMVLCLLAFCRRRFSAAYAFIAVLLAIAASFYYSTEGRAYGIVLGSAAGALLCWQMAAEGRRRDLAIALLALCSALMVAMHYYAIFFLGSLFLAEMARTQAARKVDLRILTALMLPALLILALHYPLIAVSKPFEEYYWSPAGFDQIIPFYEHYFHPLMVVSSLAVVILAIFAESPAYPSTHEPGMPVQEWVAIGALTLMPAVVIVVSKYTTHAFVERYALWAVIGFTLLFVALLWRATRAQAAVGVTILGTLVAVIALKEIGSPGKNAPILLEAEKMLLELETLQDGAEVVVIANPHMFMELSYYEKPRLQERLIYPVSRDLDLRYRGYDTAAISLPALSHRTKLLVKDCDAIIAEYPRFFLAATPEDYLPWHLVAAGYRVIPIGSKATQPMLFEVETSKAE